MTESVEDVKARVRAALQDAKESYDLTTGPTLVDVHRRLLPTLDRIEKALAEPKPTLRERLKDVFYIKGVWSGAEGSELDDLADAVLACIAEGALERAKRNRAGALKHEDYIAAVLEVDPERVT